MKKTILFSSALFALAMLASCQKEEFIETPATATGVTEFTATIESTKTTIASDGKVTWTAGDEITVTDAESKSAVYVAASSASCTTFTLKTGQTAVGAGPYTATYGDINNQKYSENGANCPLTAQSSTTNFTFSSPYAVVKLTAKSSGGELVKTVVVTYGDNGSFLDCGNGVTLTSDGVVFYVAVHESAVAAKLSVAFYRADGKVAKKTRTDPISLAAKNLLPVKFESLTWSEDTPTFKAVYNTADAANTLTFYYDTEPHVGEGVLYDNLPAAATANTSWGYDGIRGNIKSVKIDPSVAGYQGLTSTAFMFYNMTKAESISGAQYLDVSNVTNMSSMFNRYGKESTSLTDFPVVSEWDTGNVVNMANLFDSYGYNSASLPDVPNVSKWNTGKVTNMASMFSSYGRNSDNLTAVPDVSGWKTDNVEKMGNLFANYGDASEINCVLDLTGWNLAKLTTGNVFNLFSPNTFKVTIPAKTGENANLPSKWYGSGTHSFAPPTNKYFTPALAGVFSVSATKQVRFSQGNLTCDISGATPDWKFYEHQYDCASAYDPNLISLFTWGYDATKSIVPNGNTSDNVSRTSGNLEQTEDWGSQIGDGNTWRTLTTAEWQYLFDTRTVNGGTGEGKSYQRATINSDATSVYGMILYPDNYTSQTDATSYTSTEWTTMEENGCVFLPAAGDRNGSGVSFVGGRGFYWSSTAHDSNEAFLVFFASSEVDPDYCDDRYYGLSVRLITESN